MSPGQGHGTHVAGLAVGSTEFYSEGAAGVAPNCKIMPVQVFDNGMCTFSSLASGIMYAIHNGANIINKLNRWLNSSFLFHKILNEYPHVPKLAKFKLPRCPNGMFWNTLCFM